MNAVQRMRLWKTVIRDGDRIIKVIGNWPDADRAQRYARHHNRLVSFGIGNREGEAVVIRGAGDDEE